jgi:hypothetical protein
MVKKESYSSYQVKTTLFKHKEKAKYAEADLLKSHFIKMTVMAATRVFMKYFV